MAEVLVLGGGICGLTAGALLARDGHSVTLLERDPDPPPATPGALWADWGRRGVTQFHQAHYFQPRMTLELARELPEVLDAAEGFGALRSNVISMAEPLNGSKWQPGDEVFDIVTGRRPIMEAAFAKAACETSGLEVCRGVGVAGLLTDASADGAIPHVTGVRTEDGEEITADLVVDAGGRRSALPRWLEAVGARAPIEEREDFGFTYHGRYFGSDELPDMRSTMLTSLGSISALTLPADNHTWALAFIGLAGDAALRRLQDPAVFRRVSEAFPTLAHWGRGIPLHDDVKIMANLYDRRLRFVVDGEPVATGVVAVGDAWACSNPSLGRGATIGVLQSIALRDTLRSHAENPRSLALAFDAATNEHVAPWYESTLALDRARRAEADDAIAGRTHEMSDPSQEIGMAFRHAASIDPETFRPFSKIAGMLAPADEVFAEPGVFDRVLERGTDWRDHPVPGPSRPELLELLAG